MTLKFYVKKQTLFFNHNAQIASGSKNYLKARFYFSAEWLSQVKTAVFSTADRSCVYHVILEDNACTVPHEVIRKEGFLVSVFAGNLISSTEVLVTVNASGIIPGITPPEPTPDIFTQIISKFETSVESIKQTAENCETALNTSVTQIASHKTSTELDHLDGSVTSAKLKPVPLTLPQRTGHTQNADLENLKYHLEKQYINSDEEDNAWMHGATPKPNAYRIVGRNGYGTAEFKSVNNIEGFRIDGATGDVFATTSSDLGNPKSLSDRPGAYLPNAKSYSGSGVNLNALNIANLLRHRHYEGLDHPEKSVKTKHIEDYGVTALKLAPSAVENQKIADGAISERCIQPGAITRQKIANKAIGTVNLSDELKERIETALWSDVRHNVNLNNYYAEQGIFGVSAEIASAQSSYHFPSGEYEGVLRVHWTNDAVFQIFEGIRTTENSISFTTLYIRRMYGSRLWSAWESVYKNLEIQKENLSPALNQDIMLYRDIEKNTNLNTCTTAGIYEAISDENLCADNHFPDHICTGTLIAAPGTDFISQIFIEKQHNTGSRLYVRTLEYSNNTECIWHEIGAITDASISSSKLTKDLSDSITASVMTGTVPGTNQVILYDSAEAKLCGTVSGSSIQNNTPSPSVPVPVLSVKNPILSIQSFNIYNAASQIGRSVKDIIPGSEGNLVVTNIPILKANTQICAYVLFTDGTIVTPTTQIIIVGKYKEKRIFTGSFNSGQWAFPYTIPGDIDNFTIYFNSVAITQYGDKIIKNIILCVSDHLLPLSALNETAYPYLSPAAVTVPHTLHSIQDSSGNIIAQDYIDLTRGMLITNCGECIFDGSDDEIWEAAAPTHSGKNRFKTAFLCDIIRHPVTDTEKVNMLCSLFVCKTAQETYEEEQGICIDSSGAVTAYAQDCQTLAAFTSCLSQNPMTVLYPLRVPVESPLPSQLTNTLRTRYGYTRITVTNTDNVDTNMSIKYIIDTKQYIDNKIKKEIAGLTAAILTE